MDPTAWVWNKELPLHHLMGNDPLSGHTSSIPTKVVAVDLVLLNEDGSVAANVPVGSFLPLLLASPNFNRADYTVGHVQYADAVQRAEFFNHMKDNWHTNLEPVSVVEHVTVTVPFIVNARVNRVVQPVRTWFTRTATDGSTVVFMLQSFFNQQFSNIGVNAINAGDWTTDAMNIEFFPNTFLFNPSATPLVTRGRHCDSGIPHLLQRLIGHAGASLGPRLMPAGPLPGTFHER